MNYLSIIITMLIITTITSCEKNTDTLVNENFTDCPDNQNCSYLFTENADIGDSEIIAGNNRVFQASFQTDFSNASFNFKTSPQNNQFLISDKSIKAGAVKYFFSCPTCNYFGIKPLGGYVKGNKVNGSKWLIDAVFIMGAESEQLTYRDTIKLKQYFYHGLKPQNLIDPY